MKTQKTLFRTAAAVAVFAASISSAFATQITINGNGDYRAGSGGEFNIVAADAGGQALLNAAVTMVPGYVTVGGTTVGTADGTAMGTGFGGQFGFESFCIEHNENITLPGTYDAAISLGAIYGGVAGGIDHDSNPLTPNTDFISVGTAYLYQQFARGALAGYTYANGGARAASAVMLQEAFWYLEDEISLTAVQKAANTFLSAAIALFTNKAGAKANNTLYNVAVLNLGGTAPNQKQDQLILNNNGFSVPDGGTTVMLMGLSLSGLALLRRKLA